MSTDRHTSDFLSLAITCADSIDTGSTTTKDVFDELVRVSREVSQLFGPMWGDVSVQEITMHMRNLTYPS